jgi:hypothetical protein
MVIKEKMHRRPRSLWQFEEPNQNQKTRLSQPIDPTRKADHDAGRRTARYQSYGRTTPQHQKRQIRNRKIFAQRILAMSWLSPPE